MYCLCYELVNFVSNFHVQRFCVRSPHSMPWMRHCVQVTFNVNRKSHQASSVHADPNAFSRTFTLLQQTSDVSVCSEVYDNNCVFDLEKDPLLAVHGLQITINAMASDTVRLTAVRSMLC